MALGTFSSTSWRVAAGGEEGKAAEAPQPCPGYPAQSVAVLHQGQREPWHHGAGTSWLPPAPPASPVSSGNRAPSPEHSSCSLLKQKCTFRLFHRRQGEDGALLWDNTPELLLLPLGSPLAHMLILAAQEQRIRGCWRRRGSLHSTHVCNKHKHHIITPLHAA